MSDGSSGGAGSVFSLSLTSVQKVESHSGYVAALFIFGFPGLLYGWRRLTRSFSIQLALLRSSLAECAAPYLAASGALIAFSHFRSPSIISAYSWAGARYFFISSRTTPVMAFMPVRSVGSGKGANRLECKEGRGFPDFRLASTFAGSTAPSQNITEGI